MLKYLSAMGLPVEIRASVASSIKMERGDLAEFPRFTKDKPSLRSE
jgi:hypothetical protein